MAPRRIFCAPRLKGGRLERVTIGRFPEVKCEEVIRRANELIGVISTGANPAEVRRAMKAEMTFADLWDEWLERHAKRNKRWWKNDVQRYTDYLAKPIGHRKLSSITWSVSGVQFPAPAPPQSRRHHWHPACAAWQRDWQPLQ